VVMAGFGFHNTGITTRQSAKAAPTMPLIKGLAGQSATGHATDFGSPLEADFFAEMGIEGDGVCPQNRSVLDFSARRIRQCGGHFEEWALGKEGHKNSICGVFQHGSHPSRSTKVLLLPSICSNHS
jgi:hypothetical protein